MNFKYGYSLQAPVPGTDMHEVRERDYFFTVSFSLWGLWAGVGIATLWREAARELKTSLCARRPCSGSRSSRWCSTGRGRAGRTTTPRATGRTTCS